MTLARHWWERQFGHLVMVIRPRDEGGIQCVSERAGLHHSTLGSLFHRSCLILVETNVFKEMIPSALHKRSIWKSSRYFLPASNHQTRMYFSPPRQYNPMKHARSHSLAVADFLRLTDFPVLCFRSVFFFLSKIKGQIFQKIDTQSSARSLASLLCPTALLPFQTWPATLAYILRIHMIEWRIKVHYVHCTSRVTVVPSEISDQLFNWPFIFRHVEIFFSLTVLW